MEINNNKLSCWNNNRLCDKEFDEMKKKNNNYKIEIYDGDDNKKYVLLDDFKVVLQAGQDIRKEYERLKYLCDEYEEEHNNEFQCWKRDRKELLDKRGRIDNAIEYINKHKKEITKEQACFYNKDRKNKLKVGTFMWGIDELENILRGEEDESIN